ncbi:MAG TPA: ATPase, partial [Gammaproteobacteria bacterium]
MKLNASEFRSWNRKAITLLGMSGVGKTRLARILRRRDWFHYSGDYRIGTRYLDEAILDYVKEQAMQNPLLGELLRSDAIHIATNISVDNLKPLSAFLGKVGDPERGGIGFAEFR